MSRNYFNYVRVPLPTNMMLAVLFLLISSVSFVQFSRNWKICPLESSLPYTTTVKSAYPMAFTDGSPPLLTLGEIKRTMKLPCNYIHDGFFLPHSNEIANQVYQTLMELDDDDIVPVVIEVGGHDGITKSMTLKASMCLQANVMLIEASPTNYKVLKEARRYDTTVHAALCEGEYAEMEENESNSGQSKLLQEETGKKSRTVRVPCTTLDAEMDKLKEKLPPHLKSKLQLIFMVLDVEGFESTAVKGLKRYSPTKTMIEWTRVSSKDEKQMLKWAAGHDLSGEMCGPLKRDMCFNFNPPPYSLDEENPLPWMREVFYGARNSIPEHSAKTSKVSPAYMFYGK